MPRYSASYSRYSSASPSTSGTRESAITWSSSGGHNHDGQVSSLIDFEKYTVFDFGLNPIFTTNSRSSVQDRNLIAFENYVIDIISRNTITPEQIIINNETYINGENISVRTITTNQLATDSIKSLNFSYSSGLYSSAGSFFNLADGVIRTPSLYLDTSGNLYLSNSVTIGATSASTVVSGAAAGANAIPTGGAAADVNSNTTTINGGKIKTGEIESTGFAWNGSSTYSTTGTRFDLDDGQIISKQFRIDSSGNATFAGSVSGATIDIGGADTTSFHVDSAGNMWLGNAAYASAPFRVSSTGSLVASAVAITGGTLDIGGSDATSFHVASNGAHWAGSSAYSTAPFRVSSGGALVASSVAITGGTLDIGGSDTTSFHVASNGAHWAGSASYSTAPFRVSSGGAITATSATITGTINATSGSFSGNISSSATITGGTVQTASSGERVVLSGTALNLYAPNSSSNTALIQFNPPSNLYYGRIQSSGSLRIGVIGTADQVQIGYFFGGLEYGTYWNFGNSGSHAFVGRLRSYSGTYGTDWTNAQIRAEGSTNGAGMAIRAGNDGGTVQLRVGSNNTTCYFRNHNDGSDANIQVATIYKSGGTFKIHHPLESLKDDYWLYHSFVEAPYADLIYRGVVNLNNGYAEVNIDNHSGMTDGTFTMLANNVSCFTSNETGWSNVKGIVDGNLLKIYCQDNSSSDKISWLVIAERQDDYIRNSDLTGDDGRIIQEVLKKEGER